MRGENQLGSSGQAASGPYVEAGDIVPLSTHSSIPRTKNVALHQRYDDLSRNSSIFDLAYRGVVESMVDY